MSTVNLNAIADSWGSAMIRASIAGTIAFIIAWILIKLIATLSPASKSWLWRLAYVKLLAAFLVGGSISIPILNGATNQGLVSGSAIPSNSSDTNSGKQTALPPPAEASESMKSIANSGSYSQASQSHPRVSTHVAKSSALPVWVTSLSLVAWLMIVWAIGVIWCVFRLAGEWCAGEWLRRLSLNAEDLRVLKIYGDVCRDFKLTRKPKLCIAEGTGSPALLSGFNPVILLPKALAESSSDSDLRLVLAHEVAHFKRHDLLWTIVPALAHCLCYFLPTEWWAAGEYRVCQEIATDALAVESTHSAGAEYGATLVRVVSLRMPALQTRVVTVGIVESAAMLKRRLGEMNLRIARNADPRKSHLISRLVLVGALIAIPSWRLTARATSNGLLLTSSSSSSAFNSANNPGGNAGDLAYRFRQGETYIYSVKIEADEADYTEILQGNANYIASQVQDGNITLRCTGGLISTRHSRDGRTIMGSSLFRLHQFGFGGMGFMHAPFGQPNEVKIDANGHILSAKGGTDLPRALGDLSQLIIENLGSGDSWNTSEGCSIVLQLTHRLSPYSHFGKTDTERLPATETIRYKLSKGNSNESVVDISKHYEMRTNEKVGENPRLEMIGDGTIKFDRAAGVPKQLTFNVTLTDRPDKNTTVATPVKVTYQLLDGQAREAAMHPPAPVKVEPKPLEFGDQSNLVADLDTGDNFKKMNAANKLAGASSAGNSHRKEFARALEGLLSDKDGFVRQSGVRALAVWGDSESVTKLISQLNDESFAVRWAVYESLGTLHDARAAAPIATWLPKESDFAGKALKSIGNGAAPAVRPYLKDAEWTARLEACRILKEIGGGADISALKAASSDSNGIVSGAAKEAITAIEKRK